MSSVSPINNQNISIDALNLAGHNEQPPKKTTDLALEALNLAASHERISAIQNPQIVAEPDLQEIFEDYTPHLPRISSCPDFRELDREVLPYRPPTPLVLSNEDELEIPNPPNTPREDEDHSFDQKLIAKGYTPYGASNLAGYTPFGEEAVDGYTPYGAIQTSGANHRLQASAVCFGVAMIVLMMMVQKMLQNEF